MATARSLNHMACTLDRSLRFGSQLFVNPEDTIETLRPPLATLAEAGFTVIRIFIPWSYLERQEGTYTWDPFDELFDEALKWNMRLVPTLMANSPPQWMRQTNGIQETANMDDTAFFSKALDHVQHVVERWKEHPALDSWILWNEPGRKLSPTCPMASREFRNFIRGQYNNDIEAYNRLHFRHAASFDEIETPQLDQSGFVSHRMKVEWLEFSVANLQQKLTAIGEAVRRIDPVHPIHVNPHRLAECSADMGQSIWRQAEIVDFLGCSSHPAWHSIRFPRDRYADSIAMFADLIRSATLAEDSYFWVTELQGGTTLMSGSEYLIPSPAEARLWLWQCIAAGAKAVVYWCAHGRTEGFEAGEWDLLDLRGRPTPQLEAISSTVRDIGPWRPLLDRATPPRPDVGIIICEPGMLLDLAEGVTDLVSNPRNQYKSCQAMAGAYLLASDLSLEPTFYDLPRLCATPIEDLPPLLLLPGLLVIDAPTLAYLKKVVASGRWIIGDGFFAWKDLHGRLTQDQWDAADELWGTACTGYEMIPEGATFTASGNELPAWFFRAFLSPQPDAEVLGTWPDGRPAATLSRHGDGGACRMGTLVFQRYFYQSTPAILSWFGQIVAQIQFPTAPRIVTPIPGIRVRRLAFDRQHLIIVINSSEFTQTIELSSTDAAPALRLTIAAQSGLIREMTPNPMTANDT